MLTALIATLNLDSFAVVVQSRPQTAHSIPSAGGNLVSRAFHEKGKALGTRLGRRGLGRRMIEVIDITNMY